MTSPVEVAWDASFLSYDFGPCHPMTPLRLDLTMRLADELGLLAGVKVTDAPLADERLLELVHDAGYVDAVKAAGAAPEDADLAHGLGTDDTPAFRGMHEASAHYVGATVQAAEHVWSGEASHAVNISGGLHHALRGAAAGFCVYNDCGVAIARLLELGAERVAYVDVDVHHGDGVEEAFYTDPRVLTISLHETGLALFPGTGWPGSSGAAGAEGTAVNVALPPGTGDAGWLRAFDAVVPPLLAEFRPQVLVSQHGADSHAADPLAHLALSVDAQQASYAALHRLAHDHCEGRWVATGGGGYEAVEVVPRAWAHLIAIAAHRPLDPATPCPEAWRAYVGELVGRPAPARMTDGASASFAPWTGGYDPADPLDQAILATRAAVFPCYGLDPQP
ncbi:acetoin utilization protein AcuC [Motilibacter deserti]|uniref:Acetoin utilization protein AcuC n=1 Tax=Motilibacter deserti TaxID=2714956 RepID=A0ABX0GYL5_9ACTN|nr:acetoin utilization protein AcuC [Motilibacter deserti]